MLVRVTTLIALAFGLGRWSLLSARRHLTLLWATKASVMCVVALCTSACSPADFDARIRDLEMTEEINVRRFASDERFYYRLESGHDFAIPSKHQPYWKSRGEKILSRDGLHKANPQSAIAFQFFLPEFVGYGPSNFRGFPRDGRVDVVMRLVSPQSFAAHPRGFSDVDALLEASRKKNGDPLFLERREVRWGMECYPANSGVLDCIGEGALGRRIVWGVNLVTDWPSARCRYYFPDFVGGVEVFVVMDPKYMPLWRDVDDFIWKSVREWILLRE